MANNKHLDQIGEKIVRVIDKNFSQEFCADVVVEKVDIVTQSFIVRSLDFILRCKTNSDLSTLKKNDKIRIKGNIVADKQKLGVIYAQVVFYPITDYIRLESNILAYNKIQEYLSQADRQTKIRTIHNRKIPQIIRTVGLIVINTHTIISEMFKTSFKTKCVGNLFIYKIADTIIKTKHGTTKINMLEAAITHFNMKRVDIICILTDRLSIDQTLALSSTNLIKQMYKFSKNGTYIMSISQKNPSDIVNTEPEYVNDYLCWSLTNKQFTNVDDCIECIQQIQSAYKNSISHAIATATAELKSKIEEYYDRIIKLQVYTSELNLRIPAAAISSSSDPIDTLKEAVLSKLDSEKNKLMEIELIVTKSVASMMTNKHILAALDLYEKSKMNPPNISEEATNNDLDK